MSCPAVLSPVCSVVGDATSSVATGVLSAIAAWISSGAEWLLRQVGSVISSTTAVRMTGSWFLPHYQVMVAIASVVAVPMLAMAGIQAVYHQNPSVLLRAAVVHLPLAGLLTTIAVELVKLFLAATDSLCAFVSSGTNGEVTHTLDAIVNALVSQPVPMPTFVLTIGALLVAGASLVLWLELLVRAGAIYVAVLFLPLALASLIWPSVSHWCRRLTETLAALIFSKFVVVTVLSLAVGAVSSRSGFATVLAGGALLVLAAFTPYTLLRLVPIVEAGAALQLEGARARARQAWGSMPQNAVSFAMRQAHEYATRRPSGVPPMRGVPGTGTNRRFEPPSSRGGGGGREGVPGGGSGGRGGGGASGAGGGPSGVGGRAAGAPGGGGAAVGAAGGLGAAGAAGSLGAAAGAGIRAGRKGLSALRGAASQAAQTGAGPSGSAGGEGGISWAGASLGRAPTSRASEWSQPATSQPATHQSATHQPATHQPATHQLATFQPLNTVGFWEGTPRETGGDPADMLPTIVRPDGCGGVVPGVASPLYGPNLPGGRFRPGPRDDWHASDLPADRLPGGHVVPEERWVPPTGREE